jgi:hypothetical protein
MGWLGFKEIEAEGHHHRDHQPPSPELALILCSLKAINETLKGR